MKTKLFALAALVLGMVSCQKEINGIAVDKNGEAAVTISVALPEEGATRAGGSDSAVGAIDNIDLVNGYDIRYILEVYDENGTLAKGPITNYEDTNTSTSFTLRLVPGRDYKFVVWADFTAQGVKESLHYDTSNLAEVKLKGNMDEHKLMDETRDAYTGTHYVEDFSSTSDVEVRLTRPFAKLRVVTTDMNEIYSKLKRTVVTYTTPINTTFNAIAGVKGDTYENVTKTVYYGDSRYYSNENDKGQMTLFADYLFGTEDGSVQFTLDVEDAVAAIPQVIFNTNIPVQRNYLTTVTGPILTDSNNITVTIVDAFNNQDNPEDKPWYVEIISGVKESAMELTEGTYLFEDTTFNVADGAAIVVKSGNVVIDLMGVMTLNSKAGIIVEEGASLTINGVVESRSGNRAGHLIINANEGSAIGGNNITINNLAGLTAKANGVHSFGIGGIEAEVTIENTTIDYVCGGCIQPLFVNDTKYGKNEPEGGAAIGGKKITINNSTITKAEGGSKAAAIGNRFWQPTEVVITNSVLGDIFGGNASAAIGGSRYAEDSKHNIKIKIEDTTINNAVGGEAGAGIGSGYDTHCNQNNYTAINEIVIKNSNITAKGGKYAAGIGAGYHSAYLTGSIDAESIINATSGLDFYKASYTVAQNIGYGVMDPAREFSNENVKVTFTVAGNVIDTPAIAVDNESTFKTAMAYDREYISVVLKGDVTVAGGTSDAYGTANTKQITIDGGQFTLTYSDSYRTYVKLANAEGKLVFKNMNLFRETTSTNTHWHNNNMKFCNNTEFYNVVFNKGICVDNAKTFVLNNAKITKNKVATYAMFITAGCNVTIDGLEVNHAENVAGRGIKIVDEDVANKTAMTYLSVSNSKFATASKAAILVGSQGGANITVSNLDIRDVVEDSSNEVWIDEDYADYVDKVNVVGGSMKIEGQTIVSIVDITTLQAELEKAGDAGAGYTVLEIANDIDMTGVNWTPIEVDGYNGADIVTIDGKGHTIKGLNASLFEGGFAGGSGIVIKNLTIEDSAMVATNDQGYGAFVNCADSMDVITLVNCHLKNSSIITPNGGNNESRIGGLIGWTAGYNNQNDGPVDSYITVKNCSVTGCTFKGWGSIGAICGHAGANAATFTTIDNCTITNNTIISTDDGGWRVGVVVGTANNGQCVIKNITESGNTLTQENADDVQNPTGEKRNYYGRFVPAGTGTLVIDGVNI